MILHLEDWKHYPTAILHLQTKNKSFVRQASVYRSMGIKNHAFLLALINPDLEFVDPHDPEITLENMLLVAAECKINPWYYFREVARAPAIGGTDPVMVDANRGNIAMWWLFFCHVMVILIQIRQTGKSFSTDTLMALLLNIVCTNTKINLLTKDDNLRRKNVERLKEIIADLPFYLRPKTADDANNTEELTVKKYNNTYSTHVPQSSPKRALNMGRGLTTSIFHIDEPPFQPNIKISLPAALAAMGAATERSKLEGAPYGVILTTTAGKLNDPDGAYVYAMVQEAAVWTETFFDAPNQEKLHEMIMANSRSTEDNPKGVLRVNITLNHRQMGKDDDWLLQRLQKSLAKGEDADRDFFNAWTAGTSTHPLDQDVMERILGSTTEVQHSDISHIGSYILRWYHGADEVRAKFQGRTLIMGIDSSDASGGDDVCLVIIDAETLETMAAANVNRTNLILLSRWIVAIMVAFENITLIIERRSTGAMILDYLLMQLPSLGIDPFKRIFNTITQEADERPDEYKEIRQPMGRRKPNLVTIFKKAFGFATSGSGEYSRDGLYGHVFQRAARQASDVIRDQPLISQIGSLITKDGRVDHPPGGHDDLVIAWLLCNWLLQNGKNLIQYGIDHTKVMSRARALVRKKESPEMERYRNYQKQLRTEVENLCDEIAALEDSYIIARKERILTRMMENLEYEEGEIHSVESLIQSAKDRRRRSIQEKSIARRNSPEVNSWY